MKSPKETTQIIAKINKLLCPSGFLAITLFGTIYVRNQSSLNEIMKTDGIDSIVERHEMIHVKQAVATNNSWFLFYLLYLWQWLLNLPLIFINRNAPYKFVSFELEAYANENNIGYENKIINGAYSWKDFNKLTFKEKWKLATEYYKDQIPCRFRNFVNNKIKPIISNS